MKESLRIVVALGGNALSDPTGPGSVAEQFARTRETSVPLCDLLEEGHRLLITHGNGPQVGSILRRVELSRHEVYPMDLGLCVADSQASMGYMICQCVTNELLRRRIDRHAIALVTTVQVDRNDPAFANPTKPIGSFCSPETASQHIERDGWQMIEVPGKGFRRVVPSPRPIAIKPLQPIRDLYDKGEILVVCGGGGIPIVWREGWGYEGVEAVIDKDLAAALLAVGVQADRLVIITDQDCVYDGFGTPDQRPIPRLTVEQARKRLEAGEFPRGSMGPKVEAAIQFLTESSKPNVETVITSYPTVVDAIHGRAGTRFVRD